MNSSTNSIKLTQNNFNFVQYMVRCKHYEKGQILVNNIYLSHHQMSNNYCYSNSGKKGENNYVITENIDTAPHRRVFF